MAKSIFTQGKKLGIGAVLANKDERVDQQEKLLRVYPQAAILDVKLNVPGPIKNNRYLEEIFLAGIVELEQILRKSDLSFRLVQKWNQDAGCENFYILQDKAAAVKKVAIEFEDSTTLGRLFDADVVVKDQKQALSRRDLGLAARKCFLCDRPAKDCARSRRHSVKQLQEYISNIYAQKFN